MRILAAVFQVVSVVGSIELSLMVKGTSFFSKILDPLPHCFLPQIPPYEQFKWIFLQIQRFSECIMYVMCNVMYTGYLFAEPFDRSRVMQLNWLHFCGICQLVPLKLRSNTAQGCNHQSICMPQLQPLCSAARTQCTTPGEMKARVSPVQWSKPHSPHSGFEPGRPDSES